MPTGPVVGGGGGGGGTGTSDGGTSTDPGHRTTRVHPNTASDKPILHDARLRISKAHKTRKPPPFLSFALVADREFDDHAHTQAASCIMGRRRVRGGGGGGGGWLGGGGGWGGGGGGGFRQGWRLGGFWAGVLVVGLGGVL